MALCLILFVTILLASLALSCYILNKQIVEHAVYANAAKISAVPYRLTTQNGSVAYSLDETGLQAAINESLGELSAALSSELFQVKSDDISIQLGYLELSGTAKSLSVNRYFVATRGTPTNTADFLAISPNRLDETLAGIGVDSANGLSPIVLRARVRLPTDSFTRFDILNVTAKELTLDFIIPLRQQAGLLARSDNSLMSDEAKLS
jgi:cell division protein FtsI/penicillin-binding protein 2